MYRKQFVIGILTLFLQYLLCICDNLDIQHSPSYHHHHHHHNHHVDSRNMNFNNKSSTDNATIQIPPLEFYERLNQYDDIDMLVKNLVDDNVENKQTDFIKNRFGGGDSEERSASVLADPAYCQPELQTVRLIEPNNDPTIIHIPQCTRIERCGGCCNNDLFECQPTQTEIVTLKVLKTQYKTNQKLSTLDKLLIPIERHLKCRCDCRIKAKDCKQFQKYDKRQCACICINTDEREKCYQNSDIQIWNNEICACQCRKTIQCTTGSYFDPIKCKCVKNIKTRFSSLVEIPVPNQQLPYEF